MVIQKQNLSLFQDIICILIMFQYKNMKFHIFKEKSYILKNIPENNPIAILNKDVSDDISYTGDDDKKSTHTIPNGTYDFYYGDITINVVDEYAGPLSIYSYNITNNYLFGVGLITDLLEYRESMNIVKT